MSGFVIASQIGARFDERLRACLPQATVVSIAQRVPRELPPGTQVLLAVPMIAPGDRREYPAPAGWPGDLRWIQLVSVGIDPYPPWLLRAAPVSTARGTSSQAVAEFAMAAIFAAAKRLPDLWIRDAVQWRHTPLSAVAGSSLGIVGWGGIARTLAPMALALGMRVSVLRRSAAPTGVAGVETLADLRALMAVSDHLVLAAPATPQTRHLINREALSHARPGLHLINVARGSLVDQDALFDALDSGRLSRATLDVTEPEPLPAGHPLYAHPRAWITPHTSSISPATEDAFLAKVLRGIERLQAGEMPEDLLEAGGG
ncbi:MAG: NAD(P)-dependent oxidoreductase [Burkholderiaceae bacterium]